MAGLREVFSIAEVCDILCGLNFSPIYYLLRVEPL
jgi:hypothetical protein